MPVIRIVLLFVVLGGLTLLLVQNWSPVLPLVFLGMKTQALPLAIWVLISVVAGAFTSLLITGLFKLSNYVAEQKPKTRRREVKAAQKSSSAQQTNVAPSSAASSPQRDTDSTPSDDWDTDATDDDWNFDEEVDKTRNSSSQNNVRDYTSYEVNTEPKSGYRSGSVYSYNYREPKNSGVGKVESVYDADYRVIAPPHGEIDKTHKDDDWGFEDDDDVEDDTPSDSPSNRR